MTTTTKDLVFTEITLHYACGHYCNYEGEYTYNARTMTFQPEPVQCPLCAADMTCEDLRG